MPVRRQRLGGAARPQGRIAIRSGPWAQCGRPVGGHVSVGAPSVVHDRSQRETKGLDRDDARRLPDLPGAGRPLRRLHGDRADGDPTPDPRASPLDAGRGEVVTAPLDRAERRAVSAFLAAGLVSTGTANAARARLDPVEARVAPPSPPGGLSRPSATPGRSDPGPRDTMSRCRSPHACLPLRVARGRGPRDRRRLVPGRLHPGRLHPSVSRLPVPAASTASSRVPAPGPRRHDIRPRAWADARTRAVTQVLAARAVADVDRAGRDAAGWPPERARVRRSLRASQAAVLERMSAWGPATCVSSPCGRRPHPSPHPAEPRSSGT